MSVLPPGYTPDLLYRIQIGGIWRHLYKGYALPDIRVFWLHFRFDKPHRFLVPRRIIHYQSILFPFWRRVRREEQTDRVNRCLIIELFWLGSKKLATFWDDESAIRRFESPWERFYCRRTAFLVPARGYRGLYLKVHLVLIYKDQGFVFFDFGAFFLKASRSSVPS